jgi:heterodisulfide reductase subunit A-like polyferredoxin
VEQSKNPLPEDFSENPPTPVGAVLVVGGGIAGMQAALDLGDQGFKVYIVEEKSAIGGHMAQLDKTFPTNDCAMCNISPKLVDTGRHPNIEILTGTDLLDVEGEAGNFLVHLIRRPRYIDTEKCVGCGDCAEVCPISLPDLFEEGLKERKAAYRLYQQAVPVAYTIEKLGTAPCRHACPADQRAQGYIALIAQGRYKEAFRVIKEDNPFPSVCGRTCHHPCENKCTLGLVDEPVNIMGLKRFVMDYSLAYGRDRVEPAPRTQPEWIAVVGAGPAGLTAAHDLAKLGYGVTVYEALPVAGGMMRVGIPAHRLPKGALQQDIDDILALGVVLKTNSPIKNPAKLLDQGYNAVCLATGISTNEHTLGLEGEDAEGVLPAATFLRKVNLGEPVIIGNRVAVVGGGITAMDAAAVARRLGAEEVFMVLDRPRGELPAYQWEIAAVETEGIQIFERTAAKRIIAKNGSVIAIELAKTARGMAAGRDGRRRPKLEPGSEFTIEIDTVIGTVGQYSDLTYLDQRFEDLSVNPEDLSCDIPGLFVVSGRKTGASYIIEAVSLGHKVAHSIDRHLSGANASHDEPARPPVVKFDRLEMRARISSGEITLHKRVDPALLPMEERMTGFREVVLGLTEHQARAEAQRCLQCGICAECLACEYACGVDAIDHNMVAREEQLQVGSILLAPGFKPYNAALSEEYGFGRYPNVITALQFERLLSASGPTLGRIVRPSDGQEPGRIAFLQCVGSRDQSHDYCSSVCCMYATKEAVIAKEHKPDLDIHVFMMDMRAFSKGYWNYFLRARDQYGIQYTHCRASMLREDESNHRLILEFLDEENTRHVELFDMVVLSTGMEISQSVRDLANRINVDTDRYGFCKVAGLNPLETSRPGIFAAGPFREPKDIPESVIEASGASIAASSILSKARFSLTTQVEYPPERDVSAEDARIGVFVCHCGSNIAGFLDVSQVTEHARRLPGVVFAESNLYSCSQDSIKHISEVIAERSLNRVVVASCSPLTHQPLFQDCLRTAGLNPFLFEMANIRNQCSWVHSHDNQAATNKAMELVQMAVARARYLTPRPQVAVPLEKSALVVGGGPAGISAALSLADSGFPVHLVEKEPRLGGNLNSVHTPYNGHDPQEIRDRLVDQVRSNELISIYLGSQVSRVSGFKGNFNSTIEARNGEQIIVRHGVTILATGAEEYHGPEFNYGSDERILTMGEFENIMAERPMGELPDSIVMILCVGPAERYCSRICCTMAIKNALRLKELNPDADITILYKDIRTYGFKERIYTEAREKGVLFVRYDDEYPPQVLNGEDGSLVVQTMEPVIALPMAIKPDLVVLSMPIVPHYEAGKLSSMFKVPVDEDGFFKEAHIKLRPVEFSTEGIFMAGMAHYPKLLDETIIQAQAAASRAAVVLSQDDLKVGGRVAVVDESLCTGCLTCLRICPFQVPLIKSNLAGTGEIMGAAYIEPATCRGCGTCAAECPAMAIQLMHYTDYQMSAKVEALVKTENIEVIESEV